MLLEADSAGGLLTISATNLEVAIEQKIRCAPQDDDALVINAVIFERMLAKLAGESVTLQRVGKTPRVTIRAQTPVLRDRFGNGAVSPRWRSLSLRTP